MWILPRRSPAFLLLFALTGFAALAPLRAEEDERPWTEQAFLGLSVRDAPTGLVVGWVAPGPLGGRGFESTSGIRRGDNVVSLDGRSFDRAGFEAHLRTLAPGTRVELVTRRAPGAQAESAVPRGGPGGEEVRRRVVLGSRDQWSGTIGRGLSGRLVPEVGPGAFEALVLEAAAEVGARAGREGIGGGLDALLTHLRSVQEDALDTNSLPAVVQAFRQPLRLDAIEAGIATLANEARGGDLKAVAAWIRGVLDLPSEDAQIEEVMGTSLEGMPSAVRAGLATWAAQHLDDERAQTQRRQAERLLRTLRTDFYLYDEHADQHVEAIREIGPRVESLLFLSLALLRVAPADWRARAQANAYGEALADIPPEVRAVVPEGDILWHGRDVHRRIVVVGGPGPNRYDMSALGAVYDVGGNDHYDYGTRAADTHVPLQLVIDLAGDDVHESTGNFQGPATGVFGLSVLEDHAGNDTYRSRAGFSLAAGLCGIGLLIDHAGNDTYENLGDGAGWSQGAGFWGAGLLIDRAGHDVYRAEKLAQGIGGPRGVGAILDSQGKDLYVANGPTFGSAYGTPAVYLGMSQGFGFGVRGYAAGGVGAIYDYAGNDRYEAGEFSQAGGYYWGLGILHDLRGSDLYHGNRYGQAFAAHQAVGLLVDDAGDDTYWSMTAASQGGTWDESIGLLLDRAGNDSYRCDGLGQGGASMQALALLIDLGGDDRYAAGGGSTQGQGGGNAYHYDATKIFSFSGLFDLGGGTDSYRSGRTNDTVLGTGEFKEQDPAASTLYGVFVDR
jgi:hypothetical protein